MRIVGGTQKGYSLKRPKSADVRPTTEKIREALFNILRSVENNRFLDLFAGTGSVGLEALSRGAAKAVFVERNAAAVKALDADIKHLNLDAYAEIIALDCRKALAILGNRGELFDDIFIDPPYQRGWIEETLTGIHDHGLANAESIIIVQHSKREPVNVEEDKFTMIDRRSYGDSMLSFIKLKKEAGT
jgi:16S rRNA (guanine(966)-N(2))-methyltransferase RsmD